MLTILNTALFTLPFFASLLIILSSMVVIAFFAFRFRHLTLSGCVAAVVFGTSILWALRFEGFILFVLYYVLSNLAGKFLKHKDSIEKKGSNRDWIQVLANGFWPFFAAVLYFFFYKEKYIVMFASAIASSFSDTLAGDFGRLSKSNPVSLRTFKPVEKGTSGGVTALGLLVSLLSSVLIAVFYSLLFGFNFKAFSVICFAGFFGCLADSFLGATCQVIYCDNITKKLTEKPLDSTGKENAIVRGVRWIDNDAVNFLSNTLAAILALSLR